jgi:TRAP-type C4-dicarboxylate transport system substrate-binding protein
MKAMLNQLLPLLLAAALAASAAPPLKMATLAPRGTSPHQVLLEMRAKWQKAPDGGVGLTIYADGTMGGDAAVVSRMQVNQLQAAVLTVVGLAEIDNSVTALQYMPMMFRSLDEVDYVLQKLQPELERRLLAKGYVVLFWGDLGWVRIFSKAPVAHPADLKKLKVFTWSGDVKQVEIMKTLGFQPVPLETADIPSSLQTGLIAAVPVPPMYALASQMATSARYMLELNYVPLVGGAVITRKAWDAIPPATRQALLQAAKEAGDQMKAKNRAESDQAVEAMKKRGLAVQPVTAQLAAEWQKLGEDAASRIRGTIVPADMFDMVTRHLAEYRARPK